MKKNTRIIALTMAALMCVALMAGCNLVEVEKETVAATVNGTEVSIDDVEYMVNYYASMYTYYGMDVSSDAETFTEFKNNIFESLIIEEVLKQKAEELGYTSLNAEDTAAVEEQFNTDYAEFQETFREQAESDATNDATINVEERMDQLARENLESNGSSYDEAKYSYIMSTALTNLQNDEYAKVTVSEEEAKAYYDTELASQTEALTAKPADYESYVSGYMSAPSLYVPEGYRYVTHILVGFDKESAEKTRMDEITTRLGEIVKEINALDATADAEKIKTLTTEQETLSAEYATLEAPYKQSALDKANEIIAQLDAGADWAALSAQYNTDPGTMEGGSNAATGYLLSANTTGYEESFATAGMALTTIGEYSKSPVESTYGYHILKLVSFVDSGAVPYENVADDVKAAALSKKQQEAWSALQEEWLAAAKVVRNQSLVDAIALG